MIKKLSLVSGLIISNQLWGNTLNIQTLESNFKQSITNDQNAKIVYNGKIYATQKSNQALWEYNSPIIKKIYYKGGKLVIIEPELEQVIYAKLDKVPNILKLLQSAKKISDSDFKTHFNGIDYYIAMNGGKIDKISYTDEIQNKVVIQFSDEKVNHLIENSKFSVTIPPDYDILKQQ